VLADDRIDIGRATSASAYVTQGTNLAMDVVAWRTADG
jgi:hypothetical protein